MSVWLCSVLVLLNALSFIPQIRQLYRFKREARIPTILLFFNIVSAMQQLTLSYHFSLNKAKYILIVQDSDQWMHLFYATAAWLIASTILLLVAICFSQMPLIKRFTWVCLILICEFVTLLPLASGSSGRSVEISLFGFFNLFLRINPAVICVTLYVFNDTVHQWRPDSTSLLSLVGIVSQILIHIILPIFWVGLVNIPFKSYLTLPLKGLVACYQMFGWILIDNGLFAVLQGWLLWIAFKERKAKAIYAKEKSLLGP